MTSIDKVAEAFEEYMLAKIDDNKGETVEAKLKFIKCLKKYIDDQIKSAAKDMEDEF